MNTLLIIHFTQRLYLLVFHGDDAKFVDFVLRLQLKTDFRKLERVFPEAAPRTRPEDRGEQGAFLRIDRADKAVPCRSCISRFPADHVIRPPQEIVRTFQEKNPPPARHDEVLLLAQYLADEGIGERVLQDKDQVSGGGILSPLRRQT